MTDSKFLGCEISFTLGEAIGLSRIMGEIAEGRYAVGKTALKRFLNKDRARFIKSECDSARDVVSQVEEVGDVTSVVMTVNARKGTRQFIVDAIDAAIGYHTDAEEGPALRDEELGLTSEQFSVLRGLSSALSAQEPSI